MIAETNHGYITGAGKNITKVSHLGNDAVDGFYEEIASSSFCEGLLAMTVRLF